DNRLKKTALGFKVNYKFARGTLSEFPIGVFTDSAKMFRLRGFLIIGAPLRLVFVAAFLIVKMRERALDTHARFLHSCCWVAYTIHFELVVLFGNRYIGPDVHRSPIGHQYELARPNERRV